MKEEEIRLAPLIETWGVWPEKNDEITETFGTPTLPYTITFTDDVFVYDAYTWNSHLRAVYSRHAKFGNTSDEKLDVPALLLSLFHKEESKKIVHVAESYWYQDECDLEEDFETHLHGIIIHQFEKKGHSNVQKDRFPVLDLQRLHFLYEDLSNILLDYHRKRERSAYTTAADIIKESNEK